MQQPTVSVGDAKYKVGEPIKFDRGGDRVWKITGVRASGDAIIYEVKHGLLGASVREDHVRLVENGGKRKTRRRRRGKSLRRRRRV